MPQPFPIEAVQIACVAAPWEPDGEPRPGGADVRRYARFLLRFHPRHAALGGAIADLLARRWEARVEPLRGQLLSEWVASSLWAFLRDGEPAAGPGGGMPAVAWGFANPTVEGGEALLWPYRAGSPTWGVCPLRARLRRAGFASESGGRRTGWRDRADLLAGRDFFGDLEAEAAQ